MKIFLSAVSSQFKAARDALELTCINVWILRNVIGKGGAFAKNSAGTGMFARRSPGFRGLGAQPHDGSAIGGTSENRFGMSGRAAGQHGGPELEGAAEHGDRLASALCGGGNSGIAGPSAIGQTAAIYRGVSQASAGHAGRTAAQGCRIPELITFVSEYVTQNARINDTDLSFRHEPRASASEFCLPFWRLCPSEQCV